MRDLTVYGSNLEVDPLQVFNELVQTRSIDLALQLDLVWHLKELRNIGLKAGSLKLVVVRSIKRKELSFIQAL